MIVYKYKKDKRELLEEARRMQYRPSQRDFQEQSGEVLQGIEMVDGNTDKGYGAGVFDFYGNQVP